MAIWAVADIHASRTDPSTGLPTKPMDVFGDQWRDHVGRLERAWNENVADEDTVVVVGDIDWALHFDDAMEFLRRMAGWHGRKILVRGNHDYWWSSKTTNRVRRALPAGMSLLHNQSYLVEDINICGAKGSPVPGGIDWTEQNARLLNRETLRLRASLEAARPDRPIITAIHFPPFYPSHGSSPYRDLMDEFGVQLCVYGHLHGDAALGGPRGKFGATVYALVAGDAVDFRPVLLARDSVIVATEEIVQSVQFGGRAP